MPDLKIRTIQDFGEQWTAFRDNPAYYGSTELLADLFGPLLSLADVKGVRAADIGSGTGRIVNMLLDAGASHVHAVEPSAAMRVLQENTAERRDRITYVEGPGEALAAGLDLDLVVSMGVLHHIPEPEPVVAELHRVLRPGGRLVAATILLGPKINSGYPTTSNYPVMCSLAPSNLPRAAKGEILAAAKLAHEFGHVNYTATQDAALYQLQNELIPEYNRIFKLTHFNFADARLVELARLMKGTPPEISQAREYQAEANVASYLKEKFSGKGEFKTMPQPMREAIESYYQGSKFQ
jgi:SAM-dependent methyltransferase